jgi:hypothetical protein
MADKTEDTYIVATNAGDQGFLQFIHDRLLYKHHESGLVDYMYKLRDYIAFFKEYGQDIARLVRLRRLWAARKKEKGLLIMVDYRKVEDPVELERLELDPEDGVIYGYPVDMGIGTNYMGDIDQLDLRYHNDYTYVREVDHEATPNPDDPYAGCYALEGYVSPEDVLKNWVSDKNLNEAKFKKANPGHPLPGTPAVKMEQQTSATTEESPTSDTDPAAAPADGNAGNKIAEPNKQTASTKPTAKK